MTSRFSSSLVIGALGALGVIAWGCGPGAEIRYYCDSTGCFDCDAYGCSPVTAPARPACTGNASCPPGTVCTTTGCATECSTDAQCPKGETCQGGLCSPPGKDPGSRKECTTTDDCGSGKACRAGKCEACGGTEGPCPCETSKDCGDGFTCIAGACTPTKDTCRYSSDCEGDKVCADGQCLASCEAATCGDGFTCDKGVCRPTPGGGGGGGGGPACESDAECTSPDAPNCVSGSCVKSCSGDADCGTGKYCNQGACVVDTRPAQPKCATDADCGGAGGPPQKCLAGYCKYPCTDDQYCRTIDTRIGYCAKDGVCRTATEANAQCFGPGECPAGKSCIDNTCR